MGCTDGSSWAILCDDIMAPNFKHTDKHHVPKVYQKHSAHILIVEDNAVNQKLATIMLTKAGYSVVVAPNGLEALQILTNNTKGKKVDLVFMDLQMPVMDGLTATRRIREWEKKTQQGSLTPIRIPIVALTANALKGDRETCLQAGMDDYISKPIKREVVLEILSKWVFNRPPADKPDEQCDVKSP